MSILEGSVVFIDDDYASEEDTHARAFYEELLASGRPVAVYGDIPNPSHLANWEGLALAVLDWDLMRSERDGLGATVPQEVVEAKKQALIAFLVQLLDRYYCPVFIVSQRESDRIESDLREAPGFPVHVIGQRLRVVPKEDGALLPKLEAFVAETPVLSLLRVWEQEYHKAKNKMFIDFALAAADWPAHIVKAARLDGVDESHELVEALYSNLRGRVDPISFELDGLDLDRVDEYSSSARRVTHGRRVLPFKSLHLESVMPGDIFSGLDPNAPADSLWLNLTPACYTVTRRGGLDSDPNLHLIRGVPVVVPTDSGSGDYKEFDRQRQAGRRFVIVDFLTETSAYKFKFESLERRHWSEVRDKRLGRLLPPYITDVQLRHGTYLLSEGLPRVRPEIYKLDS